MFVSVWYLSQKDAVFLLRPGLVPHGQLQHVVAEIPAMDMTVDKCLVPLGLTGLLHCFCPSFAFVTVKQKQILSFFGSVWVWVWFGLVGSLLLILILPSSADRNCFNLHFLKQT